MSSIITYKLDLIGGMGPLFDVDSRPDEVAMNMETEEIEELHYAPLKMTYFNSEDYHFENNFDTELVRAIGQASRDEKRYLFTLMRLWYDKSLNSKPYIELEFYDKKERCHKDINIPIVEKGALKFGFTSSNNGFSPNIYDIEVKNRFEIKESTPFSIRIIIFDLEDYKNPRAYVTEYR